MLRIYFTADFPKALESDQIYSPVYVSSNAAQFLDHSWIVITAL
jgi:hypothetical protein